MKTTLNAALLFFAVSGLALVGMAMTPAEPQGMTVIATVKLN
jgi:hypothetical protein